MPPPRRWLRFSLRTLLIAVTFFGIWLGLRVNAARRQAHAVAEILKLHCSAQYDFEFKNDGDEIIDARSPIPKWIISRTGPDLFHDVVCVNLAYGGSSRNPVPSQCTDAAYALAQVARLPRLKHLVLMDEADDAALARVGRMSSLELLAIWGNDNITDAGIQRLTSLRRLRELRIIRANLTDESLRAIGTITTLEVLYVGGREFGDEGLSHLKGLRRLRSLNVSSFPDIHFTDNGLKSLQSLVNLEELDLSIFSHDITDEGKRQLRIALPKLRFISP